MFLEGERLPASTLWESYSSCLHFLEVLSAGIITFGHIGMGIRKSALLKVEPFPCEVRFLSISVTVSVNPC